MRVPRTYFNSRIQIKVLPCKNVLVTRQRAASWLIFHFNQITFRLFAPPYMPADVVSFLQLLFTTFLDICLFIISEWALLSEGLLWLCE